MAHPYAVAGFLAAVFPMVASPGASLVLLVRHVTTGGRRQALPVILGTITGVYLHATFAVVGLTAVLMRSERAYTVVTYVGAAYLIGLGVWTWRSARTKSGLSGSQDPVSDSVPDPAPIPLRHTYVQALLGNVLNPKAASVYLTLVPQFLDTSAPVSGQILALATTHALLIVAWLSVCACVLHRVTYTPRAARLFARFSATVLIGLGTYSIT